MLETEAKEKLCPFSSTFGASQKLADGSGPNCVGENCMAWKWIPASESPIFKAEAIKRAKQYGYAHQALARIEDVAYRNPPDGVDYDRQDGICGMIFRPLDPSA